MKTVDHLGSTRVGTDQNETSIQLIPNINSAISTRRVHGDQANQGYFPLTTALGKIMPLDEMYHGARLVAAEALHSDITSA